MMGIDRKDVQLLARIVIEFSISTCSRFVREYPLVAGVLFFLLVLYLFLPAVFYFLVYSSPLLISTAVFIRFYLISRSPGVHPAVKDEKKHHGMSSAESLSHNAQLLVDRNEKSLLRNQAIMQRNVTGRKEESGAVAVDQGKSVLSTSPDVDLISRTTLFEEKPRVIKEEKSTNSADHGEGSSQNISAVENVTALGEISAPDLRSLDEQAAKFDESAGEGELEGPSSEDEEEAREEGTKAVEWNEDDEKNLMELGDSELERNRRLESLIARRRSRKFKMNTEKSLMDMDGAVPDPVAPVFVSRSNPFNASDIPDDQIPGSAPSILLPRRNPFDIPYDPQEEKPNLMADSFQQEFMVAHQKEMFFCRHESFSLRPSSPFDQHDGQEHLRYRRHSDRGDHGGETLRRTLSITDLVTEGGQISNLTASKPEEHIEGSSSLTGIGGGRIENSDGQKQNAINHQKSESNSSISSDDNEQVLGEKGIGTSGNLQSAAFKLPETSDNPASNPLPCPIPKARTVLTPSFDPNILTLEKSRSEDHLFTSKGLWHTPRNSIASDLQVEVSENGSPPLTIDGSDSSNDGNSYTYDGDVEKDITSGDDEMWGVSPHAPTQRFKEHEMAFGQVSEVGAEASVNGGAFGVKEEHEGPTTSIILPVSFPGIETTKENEACSLNFNQDSSGGFEVAVEEVGESRLPSSSDAIPPGNMTEGTRLMEESAAQTPHESLVQEPQESSRSFAKLAEEMNISYDVDDLVHTNDDIEDLKSIEHKGGENEKSATPEVSEKLMNPESSASVGNGSLHANEKSAVAVDINPNADDAVVHVDNGVEDSETKEERDDRTEKLITGEVADYRSILPQKSTSESSRYAESSSERVADDRTILKSVTPDKEGKELKSIGNAEVDSRKAANLEGVQDNSLRDEGEDSSISAENHQEEQSRREVGMSGVNQTFSDTDILHEQEVIIEHAQDHSSSSSTPKSVLPDRIPADDRSPPDFNEHRPIYFSESDVEESTVRRNLLEVLLPQRLAPPPHVPRHDRQLIEEPYNALGRLTAEATETWSINAPETVEDLQSSETMKFLAEASTNNKEGAEISIKPEEPTEHIEGSLANASEDEAKTNQPGQGEDCATLDPGPKEKGEDLSIPPKELTEQGSTISNLHNPSANEKENVTELSKQIKTAESSKALEDPSTDELPVPNINGESTN